MCNNTHLNTYRHRYSGFGLNIASCQPLPYLPQKDVDEPDVFISFGDLPRRLDGFCSEDDRGRQMADRYFLSYEPVYGFYVGEGKFIHLDDALNFENSDIKFFIVSTAFQYIWQQRGCILIHASAVNINGKAVVFVGKSGNGKSTIAAALGMRSYDILADDMCIVSSTPDGTIRIIPNSFKLTLLPEGLCMLNKANTPYKSAKAQSKQSVYIIRQKEDPVPLGCIYYLCPGDIDKVLCKTLEGSEKLAALVQNMFRSNSTLDTRNRCDLTDKLFFLCRRIDVIKMTRPVHKALLWELVDIVERDIAWSDKKG